MTDNVVTLTFQSFELGMEIEFLSDVRVLQDKPVMTETTFTITALAMHILDQIDREVLFQYLGLNWIPAEERMPESGRRVLTYCPNTYAPYRISIHTYHVNYADAGPFWVGGRNYPVDRNYITHWAELPEGPDADL